MPEKIKILYTIPNFDTAGSGKALLKIALRLDQQKFEPHICCFHNKGEFFKVVKESGIPVHLFQFTTPMIPRVSGLKNTWKISRFFKKERFDIIHSFHYSDDYSEVVAARLSGTPWVFTKKNMNWGANSWKIRSKLASGIAAQNTDMVKNFFPDWRKVSLISRGVDTNEFKVLPKTISLLSEFGLDENARIVLTVANLVPVKGIEFLLQAFHKVREKHKNLYLFIVGDDENEYGNQLKEYVSQNQLSEKVIFTGKRYDVKNFHSIAEIFVLPTLNKGRQEGSPVALLEAMASGSLAIATEIAGIRDQLLELPNQLVKPGDDHELALKLEEYLNISKEDYSEIIKEQLKIVNTNFTIDIEVKRHQEFYLKTLGRT